jgi:alpha-1,3-rhamnosyl/mannosyltransferase
MTCIRYPELCTPDVLQYPGLLRRAIAGGAHLHVVSGFVADEVVELLGADRERVHVVRNGIEPDAVAGGVAARGHGLAGTDRYLLTVGTVEPRKDHASLVLAFAALAGAEPDLRLVLAGADGWGTAALDAAIDALAPSTRERVVRLGFVDDAARADLLAGATALAFPSVYEGFGLPPLEAMAAGVPVVATAAGALVEVLGDAADLVPVGDVDALAGALGRVLGDDAHRADLVRRGRQRAAGATWAEPRAELAALLTRLGRSR